MQVKRVASAIVLGGFLFSPLPAWSDYDDEAEKENQLLEESTGSKQGSTGNPFKGFFGFFSDSDIHKDLKGKFIESREIPSSFGPLKASVGADGKLLMRVSGVGVAKILPLERYMNRVLKRLIDVAPTQGLQANAMIMAKGDFDARSTPDGGIFLSHGMLRSLESEDELANVLAHELSHVILGHHGTDWFVTARKHATAMAEVVLVLREAIKARSTDAEMSTTDKLKFAAASKAAELLSDDLLWPSFSRTQEDEADLLGADLLIRAGYSPLGVTDFLERQAAADKIKNTAEALEAVNYNDMLQEEFKSKGFKGLVDGLTNMAIDQFGRLSAEIKGNFGHDHRETEERLESMFVYIEREYEAQTSLEQIYEPWVAVKNEPEVAGVLSAYERAEVAEKTADEGDLNRAIGLLRIATGSKAAREHSFPFLKAANVWLDKGDANNAGRNLLRATRTEDAPLRAYTRLANIHRDHGRWNETSAIIEKAAKLFEDPLQLMPFRILVAHKSNKKAAVKSLLVKCKLAGETSIFKTCKNSSKGKFQAASYTVPLSGSLNTPDSFNANISNGTKRRTTANSLNVRNGPSSSNTRLFSLSKGSVVTVVGSRGRWIKVRDAQQREGWVSANFTAPSSSSISAPKIAKQETVKKVAEKPKELETKAETPLEKASEKKTETSQKQVEQAQKQGETPQKQAETQKAPSPEERLARLKKLHEKKLISDEEYKKKREEILEKL